MLKYYIEKLGCAKNSNDAELMGSVLESKGFKYTDDYKKANFIIVNTCGFIESAKKEAIDTILFYAELKKEKKDIFLIVTGCLSQRYPEDIFNDIPEVDAVLGVYAFKELYETMEKLFKEKKRILKVNQDQPVIFDSTISRSSRQQHVSEIKIADGCNNYCSYCVIPIIRGDYRSKRFESIISEAETLAERGVKELIVIAQETTKYGVDLYSQYRLSELLERLSEIVGIEWIRIMYLNIWDINEELIKVINENEKICKYFDIPIQNISSDIIKAMNRRGNKEEIIEKIRWLRENIPGLIIRSTLITGFPGETQKQFEENLEFIKEARLERLGVFMYSDEEGTRAYEMEPKVDKDTMQKRQNELMLAQSDVSLEFNQSLVGKRFKVLIDGNDDGVYVGRTYMSAPEIDGFVFVESKKELKPGDFVEVMIKEASEYDLFGEII